MKVVYNPRQAAHDPEHQINAAGIQPYPETQARVDAILDALDATSFERITPQPIELDALYAVHTPDYIEHLRTAFDDWTKVSYSPELFGSSFVPRAAARRIGWYCADTYTTIVAGTFHAALASAETALTAAQFIAQGEQSVYALCRPPGHHAGPDYCGGFCFVNNAALAANRLTRLGKVAVLDIDYHHGNGTQHIFYESPRVQFVSIHADPAHEYPYYSGYADETGTGKGHGTTLNLPIPTGAPESRFMHARATALEAIARFSPQSLVISVGADVCEGDPEGSFQLSPESFATIGQTIAQTALPTLIVQEGGYLPDVLAAAADSFLRQF